MSTELEAELRAAFEGAAEPVTPPADLAGRVRRAARRKLAARVTSVAVVLAAVAYLTGSLVTGRPALSHHSGHGAAARSVIVRPAPGQQVDELAASGPYLYIATDHDGDPPYELGVYSRATGRPIRQVSVPAMPSALSTGPQSSVWLMFYPDQNDGPCGTWLLTADLRRRSATGGACSSAMLPTGPATALTEGVNGQLNTLTMPPPGQPGHATVRPFANVGIYAVVSLAHVGSRVAALVTNDVGDLHVVVAGQRGLSFGGRSGPLIQSAAGQADSLWVTTTSPSNGPYTGPLVRLSAHLHPITPAAIKANPALRRSEHVWSDANTLWVATASPAHRLVCFTYRDRPGTLASIGVKGDIAALAIAGHTVYLTLTSPGGPGPSEVYAYPIPPKCR